MKTHTVTKIDMQKLNISKKIWMSYYFKCL